MSRESLARLLAPLTPTALLVVVPIVLTQSWPFYFDIFYIVPVSLAFSYGGFHALALPLVALLRKHQRLTWVNVLLGGAVLGAAVGLAFIVGLGLLLGTLRYGDPRDFALTAAWGAGLGFAVSVAYAAIAPLK